MPVFQRFMFTVMLLKRRWRDFFLSLSLPPLTPPTPDVTFSCATLMLMPAAIARYATLRLAAIAALHIALNMKILLMLADV